MKKSLFKMVLLVLFMLNLGLYVCEQSVYAESTTEDVDNSIQKEKGETHINMPSKRIVTYNGKGWTIKVTSVEGSTGKITYKHYIDKECTKLTTAKNANAVSKGAMPKKPGKYYVVATVSEDENYNGCTSEPCVLYIKPQKVKSLEVVNTQAGTKLKWSKNHEADGYIVYYKGINNDYTEIARIDSNSTLTYLDKIIYRSSSEYSTSCTKFIYNVVAYKKTADGKSIVKSYKRSKGTAVIHIPITITNYPDYCKIKWLKSNDSTVKGYYIYRKISGESLFKKVKTITNPKTTSWKDKSSSVLKNGKKAEYYIKAYYNKSSNVYTKSATYTNYFLKQPQVYKKGNDVRWYKNKSASGYVVYVDYIQFRESKKISDINNTLEKGVFAPGNMRLTNAKVRSYKTVNNKTYYSAWSEKLYSASDSLN